MTKAKDAAVTAPAKNASGKPPVKDQAEVEFEGLMAEVESDLREDELKKLWQRYGSLAIAAIVALVVGVAGFQFYRQYDTAQREEMARSYDAAIKTMKEGKTDEALTALTAVGAKGGKGYGTLARLSQAALQVEKNDIDGAIATYSALAADTRADPVFRDLAKVLRVLHSLDRDDPKTLEALLAPLMTPDNPFQHSAMEMTALLAAKQGDGARAAAIAAQLTADPNTPTGVRVRAEDLVAMYKAAAPVAAPAATAPAVAAPAAAPPAAPKP